MLRLPDQVALFVPLLLLTCLSLLPADDAKTPQNVTELWADVDPRRDPLEASVVREWSKDGITFRLITYHIGQFNGRPARMAGYFAFPSGKTDLPALLHLHGGGQRAFLREVEYYARQGYACLSINWGGREMEDARPGEPNTDWGAVDPTQQNVPGYMNLQPGPLYLDAGPSPRNNNWYLLTLASRRGITFLEQQPEVNPRKIGVYGHSMGGNLTVYVAGCDSRVQAAVPSVGGSGFRTEPWPLLPQHRKPLPNGDLKLFNDTLGFESYAPHITAPLLWLGSTNDFHGIIDDTYRTAALIPHPHVRYSFTPHMNHRFTAEFAVTRLLWFDQHLKSGKPLAVTPRSQLQLSHPDGIPTFEIVPDDADEVKNVQAFYSCDPHPPARFWRTAKVTLNDGRWLAKLPVHAVDAPLFVFANVTYDRGETRPGLQAEPTSLYALSSQFHVAMPDMLAKAGVKATLQPSLLIDDFSRGFQDWYQLSAGNPHHWEFSTRKISDPLWRGPEGSRLAVEVQAERPNELIIVLAENVFRSDRGRSAEYVAVAKLAGGPDTQTVVLSPHDFRAVEGDAQLASWSQVDLLSLRAYHEHKGTLIGSKQWQGARPQFNAIRWTLDGK